MIPTNPAKARVLLKTDKAKVVSKIPFTIKLNYNSDSYTHPVIASMEKGTGIVKGKRSTGYFAITDIFGNKVHDSVNVKRNCKRLRARASILIQMVAGLGLTHSFPTCQPAAVEKGVS